MQPNEWIPRVPVYEPGRPMEEVARELGFDSIEDLVKVASNENELGPSPRALEAMAATAGEMHRYPDGGCFYLKQKLAELLGLQPGNLLFGNGSNELIEFLGHVYLNPESSLVMSECAFVVYRLVAALFQAGVTAVPMKHFTHDLDAMLEAVTPQTRLLIVCNPNNPTGTFNPPREIDRLIERLPDSVLAVFDEAYYEVMPEADRPDVLRHIREGRKNVLVLRTFSKAYGLAGLRLGYAVAHEETIALLNHVRQPFNVNAMALAAGLAALDDPSHLDATRAMVAEGLDFLAVECAAMDLETVPSAANFILVKTGDGRRVFEELQSRKVIARPMNGYGLPEWVRITVGTPKQNRLIMEALRQILL